MNLSLGMEVLQALDHLLYNGRQKRFVLDTALGFYFEHVCDAASSEERHYEPEIRVIDEGDIVANDVFMAARRHNVDFLSDVIHVTVLEMF